MAEVEGREGAVTDIAISADSPEVVSSGEDFVLCVWNFATATERLTLRGHEGAVFVCAVSPDGRMIASGGADRDVRLWDRQTGAGIAMMQGHTDSVTACVFAPDGAWLATGGGDFDGTLRLWDLQSREARFVLGAGAAAVFNALDGHSATLEWRSPWAQ